jgi:hypothetical protein
MMRYSENYIQVCQATEAHAAGVLGRALTTREKQAIWGAGTLTWLEMVVQVPMRKAVVPEQVETILDSAAGEIEGRLAEMVEGLAGMLGALLERDLSTAERQHLDRIPTVIAVIQMGEDVADAEPAQRESLLEQLLEQL